ncbi:hypothetical protein [Microcoleus sp. bin38.metabat.b11b12b14.051]|uniref:hypothetical protein n=1 Tax=Microcoleus sp. bin38.metabat.b11b12b14.051 TaxID=2742709 RepID=UPI0025EB2E2C|nr:hypothetical protein [Microcoleus sp. bin38.metabat.b11b12b14.051]
MATITGTIKVNVDVAYVNDPKFAGVYTGDFSYDDTHLTKVGTEVMDISGANGNRPGLLSFKLRFLDFARGSTLVTYTENEVLDFSNCAVLAFENGLPSQFCLHSILAGNNDLGVWGGNNGFMFGDPGIFYFVLRNGAIQGQGTVTLEINEPTAVLENFSPFTSLLAFLGLGRVPLSIKSKKPKK